MDTMSKHTGDRELRAESRTYSILNRLLASTVVGVACIGAATSAHAAKYKLVILPALEDASSAQVTAINNHDQVIGSVIDSASGDQEAVIWNGEVPTLVYHAVTFDALANAINDKGIVVGLVPINGGAFAWSPASGAVSISYYGNSDATGINNNGVIVGTQGGAPASWASPFGETGPLPTFESQGDAPVAINNVGVVVGSALSLNSETQQAARFEGASSKNLGTLGGLNSEAVAVNDRGFIVGWAQIGNGNAHATLWGPNTGPYSLGTLGGKQSYANAVNIQGDVAGTAQTASGAWHAVLWTHAHYVPSDLNYEISPADTKAYTLISAVGTNIECRVIANGIDNKTGASLAFILYLTDPTVQKSCSDTN
jgi:probable HAF family extracellular repeat protein